MVFIAAGVLSGCAEQVARPARVDPQADEALRKMSAALAGARAFSVRGAMTMDEAVAPGQLAQFSRETRIVVRRPDRLMAERHEGEDVFVAWYTGNELTILDKRANTCAVAGVPGRIDDMLDEIATKYGLTMPLADLLFADPYKVLIADVLTGKYLGLHEAGGVKCDHLLFTQENVDWQIWIDAGRVPLPRKVVIDYKHAPGRPQFTAMLSDWDLAASADEGQFRPALPQGVKKVKLTELLDREHREK